MMAGFSGVGCQTAFTASQTSTAKSISVPVKLSGEYWNTIPFLEPVPRNVSLRLPLLPQCR